MELVKVKSTKKRDIEDDKSTTKGTSLPQTVREPSGEKFRDLAMWAR